jgi:hypothetical protein
MQILLLILGDFSPQLPTPCGILQSPYPFTRILAAKPASITCDLVNFDGQYASFYQPVPLPFQNMSVCGPARDLN